MKIHYPTSERIITCNIYVLRDFKVKKADKPEVLSRMKIDNVVKECTEFQGDLYEKASCLLKNLVKVHAFASGNRRTAFLITRDFLIENKAIFAVQDDPKNARVLQGIREDFYTQEEIVSWIKHGKIRDFNR